MAARTSSFQFKGKADDIEVIGRKLNVATVLGHESMQVANLAELEMAKKWPRAVLSLTAFSTLRTYRCSWIRSSKQRVPSGRRWRSGSSDPTEGSPSRWE